MGRVGLEGSYTYRAELVQSLTRSHASQYKAVYGFILCRFYNALLLRDRPHRVLHTKDTNNKKRKQHKKQTPRKPTHKQDPDIAIKHVSTVWVMGVTARG